MLESGRKEGGRSRGSEGSGVNRGRELVEPGQIKQGNDKN